MAIPGVAAENVELEIDGTQLQLRVKQPAVASEEYRVIHRERSLPTGSLELSFRNEVDAQSTSASLVDGVLTISGKYLVRSHKVAIRVAKPTEQSNA